MWVDTRKKRFHRSSTELPSGDILTSTSLTQVLGVRLQDMWWVLMMLVCSWFNVHRDIAYYFIWDSGGGWSHCVAGLLEDKQFQGGRTVMSPFFSN
jgi:hypothetical protein